MTAHHRENPDVGSSKNSGKEAGIGKCPECGADVIDSPKSYSCSAWREGCKFTLWKNSLEKFGGKPLTVGQAKNLLSKRSISLSNLKARNGNSYSASGKLVKHEKFGWQVGLEFGSK